MNQESAKQLYGNNYIGCNELKPLFRALGFGEVETREPPIHYSDADLQKAANDGYILIYGLGNINGHDITLKYLRKKFGVNPEESEPCFYNQDWYMKEDFMDTTLDERWYLIKKDVFEDSRAVMPTDLTQQGFLFPLAILCGYTFFAYYFANNEYLWWHDFVWCSDTDHNGDRIYVGKYHDVDGVNKNGFSIHRHLALRSCYASITYIE